MAFVMVWNRQLSAAEIQSLSVNPWQVFQPQPYLFAGADAIPSIGGTSNFFAHSLIP